MLLSETIDMETAEETWRRVVGVHLRINGKLYSETYNLSITISLNIPENEAIRSREVCLLRALRLV